MTVHPIVAGAARGELPSWARMGSRRRAHAERVALLMGEWADHLETAPPARTRWLAAAWLHDCLKDAPEAELRAVLGADLTDLPEPVLHGPAAARRLRDEGVDDEELLTAVAYHTLGHRDLGPAGRALYVADFLEPGRGTRRRWRAALRARMPDDREAVLREILRARIEYLLRQGRPVRPETVGFWNRIAEGEAWARASEV